MNHLNIACYAYNFDGYDGLYDLVKGLDNVGVELSMHYDMPAYTKNLKAQAERFSDFYVTFHGPYVEIELSSALNSLEHEKTIFAFQEALEIYHEFSAGSILMHTNQRGFAPEEKFAMQENVAVTLTEMAKMAERDEALLLVENVGELRQGNMLFGEDEFIKLFSRLPSSVHSLIDIGHASLNGWDIENVIRSLGSKIKSYHLHNNDGIGDIHRPLFEKGMRMSRGYLKSLFGWIERYSPQADWILEYAPGDHITKPLMIQEVRDTISLMESL
jgi:sugar phosphate isomerase/epimerase